MKLVITLTLVLLTTGAVRCQEVGKPLPKWNWEAAKDEVLIARNSPKEGLKGLAWVTNEAEVRVFFRSMDEASLKLISQCNAALSKERNKQFRIKGYLPPDTDKKDAASFLAVAGVGFDCRCYAREEFSEWKALEKLPVAVVSLEGKVLFVGSDGLERAIDEAVEASQPSYFTDLKKASKAVQEALAETEKLIHRRKIGAACKAAATALEGFKGGAKEKLELEQRIRGLEDQYNLSYGVKIAEFETCASEQRWLEVRENLAVYQFAFDLDEKTLEKSLADLLKAFKGEAELKVQDALAKLLADTAAKTRKDRAKALRDFARKNKGTVGAQLATERADHLDLVEKKMAAKPK